MTRTPPTRIEIDMPDGSVWGVPISVIARNRAEHYADEFDGDVARSLTEDTDPLFAGSDFEIVDWAKNNMNWSDVEAVATRISGPKLMTKADMQLAWIENDFDVK